MDKHVKKTTYSDSITGDHGNYNWVVTFDLTGGYLGITQKEGGSVKDRVLLSPRQLRALLNFVEHEQA